MELGSRSRRCCATAAGAKGSEASAIRINAPQPDRRNSRQERTHVFIRPLIRSPRTPTGQEGKPKIVAEERRMKQRHCRDELLSLTRGNRFRWKQDEEEFGEWTMVRTPNIMAPD